MCSDEREIEHLVPAVHAGRAAGASVERPLVWALSNPAPSGMDEAVHYIKALATGQGEPAGPHVPYPMRSAQ